MSDKTTKERVQFRPHVWLNTDTLKLIYAIQAKFRVRWVHVSKNGEPLFFSTASERDARMSVLQERHS